MNMKNIGIIRNWVETFTTIFEDGEQYSIITDIIGELTSKQRKQIEKKLKAVSQGLIKLYGKDRGLQFYIKFSASIYNPELQAGEIKITSWNGNPEENTEENSSNEELKQKLADVFKNLTDYYKTKIADCIFDLSENGVAHSSWNDDLNAQLWTYPFNSPLILPELELEVEKAIKSVEEPGIEKYIKVKVREWSGKVEVSTIASYRQGDDRKAFLEAVDKESKHLPFSEYTSLKRELEEYNKKN